MAVFPSFKLTEKGEELLNRSIGEGKQLTFTKFELGDGNPPSDFRKQTGLVNKFYEFPILNTSIQKDQVLRIRGYFDNKSFSQDKQLKEIGVFVKIEGNETQYLYSYTNAGDTGDIIPSNSRGFYSRTLDVANYIGYATNITFNIEQLRDRYAFNTENEMKVASYLKAGDKVELWGNLVLGDKPTDEYIIQESGEIQLSNGLFAKKVSFNYIVQKIEELQRLALKVGDVVELNGYYTAGDGANHKRIIANEDDGSGVQLNNGLWANIVHNGEVNVSWFGAKGDGVSDEIELFKKVFNYISENNVRLYLQKEKHYILNDVIKVLNFKTNLDIDGQNSILDFNANQKLGYFNMVGNFINISRETEDNKSYAKINNLICLGNRYQHTDSTTIENCNGFGGISLSKFYNVEITNLKEDSISFSGGIGLYAYKISKIENVELTNCGRKFMPTTDSTSQYDAAGDAIYLAEFKENAVTIINNVTASSWEGKYGRCGIVYEYSRDTQNHYCNVTNFYFKGYHRTIHQEDGGATKSSYDNGVIEDSAVGFFSHGNSKGAKFDINNIEYSNGELSLYGNNGGVFVQYSSPINTIVSITNSKVIYNNVQRGRGGTIQYNNCDIFYKTTDNVTVNGAETFNKCQINFDSDAVAQFNNQGNTVFNECAITGTKIGHRVMRFFGSLATFNNCKFTDACIYLDGNRKDYIARFKDCIFDLKTYVDDTDVLFGYASYAKLESCVFNNLSGQDGIRIYGDGGMYFYDINNCEFNNIRLDLINNSTPDMMPKISNCTFNATEDYFTEFFKLYRAEFFMTGCKFNQANGTTTYPTPNTTHTIIRDCVVYKQDKSVVILDSQATEPTEVLNTPVMMYAMEQEGGTVKQDYLNYSLEKMAYDKQVQEEELAKQEAYELALQENPNLSYEEFMSIQPMTLNLVEEPQPSEALKKFMEKYL